MRKFQDAYQDAVNELPKYHMDVESVMEETHHARFASRQMHSQGGSKRYFKMAATAAALFLLCGVGTATAMNYQKSKITVGDTGYSVTSQGVEVVSDELMVVEIATEETGAEAYGKQAARAQEEDSFDGAVAETVAAEDAYEAVEVLEAEESVDPISYESLEAFRANEDIVVAIPDSEMLGMEFEIQNIMVMEVSSRLMVRLQEGEQIFALRQHDTREYKQYASSTAYMGESVNEREFINGQGLAYVVFDTMEEGEITSTHAVISVNGRDLSMDFYGFEQEVIENVLTQLDLSIYFQD